MDLILLKPPVNKSLKRGLVDFWKLEEASGTRYSVKTPGIGPAAQFTAANSEYLSIADNASVSTGDIDFSIAAWVYLDTKPASGNRPIVAKGTMDGTGANDEYALYYNQVFDRFRFFIANGTTFNVLNADALGSPSTATWYFIVGWHDSVANTINIQINNGTVDSQATTITPQDGAGVFNVGYYGRVGSPAPTFFMDGRIQSVGFWKKVLSAAERTSLYNSGLGMAYRNLSGSLLTSLNAYWNLNEATGVRYDETANNNDLTDNNTVTQAIGVAGGNSLGEANTVTQAVGKIGNAGQFTSANSEYLATPDNADLSMGDIDFTVSAWVYLDSLPGVNSYRGIVGKWESGTQEYVLNIGDVGGTARFGLVVRKADDSADVEVLANTFGTPTTSTWYHLCIYHDSVTDTIGISINNGGIDTTAIANGVRNSTSNFEIGAYADGNFFNGRIDGVGIWKRVLTTAERTRLYNGGNGREFPF